MRNEVVKVGWIFYFSIRKISDKTISYKTRGANFFSFICKGYALHIGMPYSKAFVKYHVHNSYGLGVAGLERENEAMLSADGFKLKMPKKKYVL